MLSIVLWWLALIGMIGIIASCSVVPMRDGGDAMVFELKKQVVVPAGLSRVYFQTGRQLRFGDLDTLRWYCLLQLTDRSLQSPAITIAPARFRVTGLWRYRDVVMADDYQVAELTWWWQYRDDSAFTYLWHLRLQNVDQPRVQALECGYFAEANEVMWPGVARLNQVLGSLAELGGLTHE